MFKTPEDLKAFIIWAKEQRIARVKVDKIEVEMSPLAFVDSVYQETDILPSQNPEPTRDEEEAANKAQAEEDDGLLFWSSNSRP